MSAPRTSRDRLRIDDRYRDRRSRLAAAQELEQPLLPAVLLADEPLHIDGLRQRAAMTPDGLRLRTVR